MGFIKKFASDGVIYGATSIIRRLLNYLLTPFQTKAMGTLGYGVFTNLYAYNTVLLTILTYGMETTLSRFTGSMVDDSERDKAYTTILTSIFSTTLLFVILVLTNLWWIPEALGYGDHPEYVAVMTGIVAIEVVIAILNVRLRMTNQSKKFLALNMLFIIPTVLLNMLYYGVFAHYYESYPDVVGIFYNPSNVTAYALYINLACSAITLLGYYKEVIGVKWQFDWGMLRRVLSYSWPLLVLYLAGSFCQNGDRILLKYLSPADKADYMMGVYGGCIKVAVVITMLTQAFRYALEPIIFSSKNPEENTKERARGMFLYVLRSCSAYLIVIAGMDVFKHFINSKMWEGLFIVPMVMITNIIVGINNNLSFWYKLEENRTLLGALVSIIGLAVMITVNFVFVPTHGYVACVWGGLAGSGAIMVMSYFMERRFNPINYPMKKIAFYVLLTAALYYVETWLPIEGTVLRTTARSAITLAFILFMLYQEDLLIKGINAVAKMAQRLLHRS